MLKTNKFSKVVMYFFFQFYPVMLIFPLCVTLVLEDVNSKRAKSGTVKADIAKTLAIFSAAFIGLNYASYVLMANSWNFIHSTHGFTLGKRLLFLHQTELDDVQTLSLE